MCTVAVFMKDELEGVVRYVRYSNCNDKTYLLQLLFVACFVNFRYNLSTLADFFLVKLKDLMKSLQNGFD